MAKPLVFQFGDRDLAFELNKIDRSLLYGSKSLEAVDGHGDVCELATLTNDGQTLIGPGGTGMGYLNADGEWRDKSDLTPVDVEGKELEPVASSFSAPIKLFDTVTVEEYFRHNIKSVYQLPGVDGMEDLVSELKKGTIFSFPFSYRGGLEANAGFLLLNDAGEVFLTIGTPTRTQWVGHQQSIVADEGDDLDADDLMDFDMV